MSTLPDVVREEIPALTIGGFRATEIGLRIEGQPSYEAWQAYGRGLQAVQSAIHWVIGDWLNYGESRYGEKYAQALELLPYSLSTLQSDVWVAKQIPTCNRLVGVRWKVHREVAALPIEQQRGWLMQAQENEWNASELRAAIRGATEPGYDPWLEKLERLVVTINNLSLEAEDGEDVDALLMARDMVRDRIDARKEA